jgi:hypothetical protein
MVPMLLLVQPPPKVEGGDRRKAAKGVEDGVEPSAGRDGVVGGSMPRGVCWQRLIMSFKILARAWDHLQTTVSTLDLKF